MTNGSAGPGWYDDPWEGGSERWWDGERWTPDLRWPGSLGESRPAHRSQADSLPRRLSESRGPESRTDSIPTTTSPGGLVYGGGRDVAQTAPRPGVRVVVGLAIALVAVAAVVTATNLLGDGATSVSSDIQPGGPGTHTASVAGGLDDWLDSVCEPGTFADRHSLPGADGGGICIAQARRGPIYVAHYSSDFALKNDLAKVSPGSSYAQLTDLSGTIWVFVAWDSRGDSTAVSPLVSYGFEIGTISRG